jgi:hypothetical protein
MRLIMTVMHIYASADHDRENCVCVQQLAAYEDPDAVVVVQGFRVVCARVRLATALHMHIRIRRRFGVRLINYNADLYVYVLSQRVSCIMNRLLLH